MQLHPCNEVTKELLSRLQQCGSCWNVTVVQHSPGRICPSHRRQAAAHKHNIRVEKGGSIWLSLCFCRAAVASLTAACVQWKSGVSRTADLAGKSTKQKAAIASSALHVSTLGFLASNASYIDRSLLSKASIGCCFRRFSRNALASCWISTVWNQ